MAASLIPQSAHVGVAMTTVVTLVCAVGGLIGLVVSLIFLAVQTRAVSNQVRASNNVAGTQALDGSLAALREINFKLLEYPGLRAYFYDGKTCPRRGPERVRVLLMTDVFADVLDSGCQAARRIPDTESEEDWASYCRYILDRSPTLRAQVAEQPNWWPDLAELCGVSTTRRP